MHSGPEFFRQDAYRLPQLCGRLIHRACQCLVQRQHRPPQAEAVQVSTAVQRGADQPGLHPSGLPPLRLLSQQGQEYILIDILSIRDALSPA